MERSKRPSRELRRRLRKTAAKFVEDISVRSELTDVQAKELLKWGLDYVEAEAAATADLPEEEALPLLDEKTTAVRTTMLLFNKLMRVGGTEEDAGEELMRLLKNLTWLTGRPSGLTHLLHVNRFKRRQDSLDKDEIFRLLMDLIHAKTSDEEE
jgi:hypothetical protein